MKKPIIAIVRGKVATGKSTAYKNLKIKLKDWVFVDHPALKEMFQYMGEEGRKNYGKIAMLSIMKEIMKEGKNIFLDEVSRELIEKRLKNYLKRYGYEIIVFQFDAKLEDSIKREEYRRVSKGKKPLGEEWVKKMHAHHERIVDPEGIVINTSKLSERQVVNFILKRLK